MNESTITLNRHQRQKAESLLDQNSNGEIEQARDITDSWESVYQRYDYDKILHFVFNDYNGELVPQSGFIDVTQVKGATSKLHTIIQPDRIDNILKLLLLGEYNCKPERPPKRDKIGEHYYVSLDGNHH